MNGSGMLAGMGWLGLLLLLLLWGGAVGLVIWGLSRLFPTGPVTTEADALAILRQRYTQGEISREEFLLACATLSSPEQQGLRDPSAQPR